MTITDAILAAVTGAVPATAVYDTDRPFNDGSSQTPARYAVITLGRSWTALSLSNDFDSADLEIDVLSVGLTRAEVESISTAIGAALLGKTFTSAPWSATVHEHHGQKPRRDPDIPGRVVIYATDQYLATATRA